MKDAIISILILSALIAGFSFWGENIPYKFPPKEGLAFSDGESGTPIPKDGADGHMNVFTISDSEQAEPEAQQTQENTTAQGKTDFPISVSGEKQTAEKPNQTQEWEIFLCGVGVGALAAEIAILIPIAIYYIKRRIRHEKRKSRTHKTHRVP
jgi:hypothetical protein